MASAEGLPHSGYDFHSTGMAGQDGDLKMYIQEIEYCMWYFPKHIEEEGSEAEEGVAEMIPCRWLRLSKIVKV